MATPGMPDGMAGVFGGMVTQGNARRGTEIAHRVGVTALDCLLPPVLSALTAITEAGSNLTNASHHVVVAAGNRWGPTTVSNDPGAITPTANQAVRVPIAQVVGADYYDVFIGTPTVMLWVGRITELQRLTGDQIISAVGVVSARAGSTVAGTIDLGIVGTGVASTAAPFAANMAFTPAAAGIVPVNVDGCNGVWVSAKMTVTDLRSLPTLQLTYFRNSVLSPNDWFRFNAAAFSPLASNTGIPLEAEATLTVNGALSIKALVSIISGQGTSVDVWLAPII